MTAHACGKVRYPSGSRARQALRAIRTLGRSDRKPCRAYPCNHCHGWHLTSQAA